MKQEIIITTTTESVKSSEMTDRDKAFYNEGYKDGHRPRVHVFVAGMLFAVLFDIIIRFIFL